MSWIIDRAVPVCLLTLLAWLASSCTREERPGLRVDRVEVWGAAAAAGIETGDVVESWRTATGGGDLSDPLELLWIELDVAPREPVTLTVRRAGERREKVFEDCGWEMAVRPALPAEVGAAYQRTQAPDGDRPAAWDELERRIAAFPEAGAWAAWRRGVAAAASQERSEEASLAFERARSHAADRPWLEVCSTSKKSRPS
jgi:hypothetical protein